MLHEAAPYVSRPVSDLDREALALNALNGTLRFVETGAEPAAEGRRAKAGIWTVRLDPHRREDMISKLVPVDFDPAAECPNFLGFIETVLPSDEVRAFVQRYLGYALTALTREQVFCFLWGQGRNGKSTLVDLVCRIFGDYAATVPFETLAGDDRRKGSEATPDLARLPASRLVRASEPESKMQFREAMVKSLTSGEPILVRRLHQDFVEIYPAFKLVISGNHKPSIHGTDEGIWRRVLLVPFEVQIPPEEIDRRLPDKLWEERSGILNWLIAGTLSYLEEGLRIPDAVRAATQEYREESDPVGGFLRDACEITGEDADIATPGELHEGFKVYCERAGLNAWGPSTFTRQLPLRAAAFGFRKAKTMGMSVYRGIRVKADFRPSHTHGSGADPGWQPDDR
jgi:putative DNA primase/helicase